MDIRLLVRNLLSSESLLDDINTNSPPEIRVHLPPIFRELWIYTSSKKNVLTRNWTEDAIVRLEACLDRTWESLNSGYWKDVPISHRYCYSFCSILKSALLLLRLEYDGRREISEIATKSPVLRDVILQIDKGILLGAPPPSVPRLLPNVARKLNSIVSVSEVKNDTHRDDGNPLRFDDDDDDVRRESEHPALALVMRRYQPSMETFYRDIFQKKIPAVLEGCMEHWRALDSWRDPNYLIRTAGFRTVPIEIGSRYTEEDWTQRLVTLSEFLESYVMSDHNKPSKPGYLAQHGLFDQIPELMDDISVPDYCSFSDTGEEATPPEINAWLGPGGTVSPLHFDPKNNLLCQVFGVKRVILYHPGQTLNLYPYETRLLSNTARVDPTIPDFETWPKFKEATGVECVLGPGEMLFIPPGWWHYVAAASPSFSVSFWWD